MTELTKDKLFSTTIERLKQLTKELDQLSKQHVKITSYSKFLSEDNFRNYMGLLNFRMITVIINLDLCAATIAYLRAELQYESINSCRQIVVIIYEGYKKIYNLITKNNSDAEKKRNRNNSFWIKEIGLIISNDLSHLKPEYDEITEKLDEYLDVNFDELKYQRDLSIHYDKNPIKVYEMLISLNAEAIFKKLIPFLNIINSMSYFSYTLVEGYLKMSEIEKQEQQNTFDKHILRLEALKSEKNKVVIEEIQQKLLDLNQLFKFGGEK